MNRIVKFNLMLAFGFTIETTVFSIMAQTTAFSYQGRLNQNGSASNGTYDFSFSLFNANSNGVSLSGTTNFNTCVSNGIFTTTIDLGDVFDGSTMWLEIGVRTNGETSFSILSPRQSITASPYAVSALHAKSITSVLAATNLPPNVALLDGNNTFLGNVTASTLTVTNPVVSGKVYYAPDYTITEVFPSQPVYTNMTRKFMNFAGSNSFTVLRAAFTNVYGPYCTAIPPTGLYCTTPIWFNFGLDADSFIFSISGHGEYCGMSVDGNDDDSRLHPASDGSPHYYQVSFSNRRQRQIMLKLSNGGGFLGCWIPNTGGWLNGSSYARRRMIVLGDSFTEDATSQGFTSRLMQLFKNLDVWASGVGGTGYINTGVSGRTNFQGRVLSDVVANKPDCRLAKS